MALSSNSKIIVDDVDSRIQYSQHWFADDSGRTNDLGNFGPTFRSTLHGVNTTSSLRFDFIGTSVDLYGTTDIRRRRGTPDPTCECFIDGVSIGAVDPFGFAENNWRLCGAPNLTDGAHTLTVNVRSRGQTFWVDYIAFTASSIVSTSNEVYQMQNINPGIQYDPSWQPFASGMTDLTSRKGATVSLTFLGSHLTWVGIIPGESTLSQSPALASYSLDGNTPVPFAIPALPDGSPTLYNQRLFRTSVLQNGLHNITVTYESEQPSTPLTLDYLLIQNGTGLPGATPTSVNSIVPASPSSPPPGFTPSNAASTNNKGSNVPAIIGGLIGFFALILIVGIIYRYYKNREKLPDKNPNPNKIQPFVQPPPLMIQRQPSPDSRSLGSNRSPDDPFRTEICDAVPETITVRQPQPRRNHRPLSRPVGERPRIRQSMPPPNSPAGPSTSSDPALTSSRPDEDYSYYGGYQTWAENKALEAEASKGLNRDSYI
ncbi:hypothetical protein BJ165DRAFT_1531691 [Panaeolus papilionaceus]|nr:hypothetical protein BJ165DRAFT_1531691 [Panaeolus papilionaceus]